MEKPYNYTERREIFTHEFFDEFDEVPKVDVFFEGDNKNRQYLTVTEITNRIKDKLESDFMGVWVIGEVSNVRKPGSGHVYLTLKDKNAQLQAVIFKSVASKIKFELKDGEHVVVYGSISVYEPRGQYQIKVESVEPKGVGALQLAFQQLKARLEKEGLFDPSHKKELPFLPERIAIVTSLTGAAVKDMVNIINRRFSGVQILIYSVKVQGDGAAEEISAAICEINRLDDIDVMIVGRGGGSIEDLWAFNEEIVARSIYKSTIPVISAVGHEIDVTIADFVADKRALTPSEAGEMVVPRYDLLMERLDGLSGRLVSSLHYRVKMARNRLKMVSGSYAFRKPMDRLYNLQQRLDDLTQRMDVSIHHRVEVAKGNLAGLGSKLDVLSPICAMSRGYSITTSIDGTTPVKDVNTLKKGDKIKTRLFNGSVVSVVETLEIES